MASAGAASDHPLSPLETPIAKPTRRKLSINPKSDVAGPSTPMMPPVTSYFALKLQSEERERTQAPSFVVDGPTASSPTSGKVRLPSQGGQRLLSPFNDPTGVDVRSSTRARSPIKSKANGGSGVRRPSLSLSTPALPPSSSQEYQTPTRRAASPRYTTTALLTPRPLGPASSPNGASSVDPRDSTRVLATQWHTLSNADIDSELRIGHIDQYDALRILSAALESASNRFHQADDELKRTLHAQAESRENLSQTLANFDPPISQDVTKRIFEVACGSLQDAPLDPDSAIPISSVSRSDDLVSRWSTQQQMI